MKCLNILSSSLTNTGRSFWRLRVLAFCLLFFSILSVNGCAATDDIKNIAKDVAIIKTDLKKVKEDTTTGIKTFKVLIDDLGITTEKGKKKIDVIYEHRNDALIVLMKQAEDEKKHREKEKESSDWMQMLMNLALALYMADKFKILKAGGNILGKITGINKDKKEKA